MSFVDFNISSELKVNTITKDNVYEVEAKHQELHTLIILIP